MEVSCNNFESTHKNKDISKVDGLNIKICYFGSVLHVKKNEVYAREKEQVVIDYLKEINLRHKYVKSYAYLQRPFRIAL